MKTEPGRVGIGTLECVDNGADGIEQPADDHQNADRCAAGRYQLRHPEDGSPAHHQIQGDIEPARSVHPQHSEQHLHRSRPPDQAQQHDARCAAQQGDRQRGVGACDEDRDIRVIDTTQDRRNPVAPVPAVVDRRVAEQHEGGHRPDRAGDSQRDGVRRDHQDQSADKGDRRVDQVQPATQPRFGLRWQGRDLGLSNSAIHRTYGTVGCAPKKRRSRNAV